MKTLHKVNIWMFGITLVLYITVIGGLLAQVVLGFTQVMFAFILAARFNSLAKQLKTHMTIYYITAVVYLFFFFATAESMFYDGFMMVLFYMVLPMAIAGYFVYITREISRAETHEQIDTRIEDEILD